MSAVLFCFMCVIRGVVLHLFSYLSQASIRSGECVCVCVGGGGGICERLEKEITFSSMEFLIISSLYLRDFVPSF